MQILDHGMDGPAAFIAPAGVDTSGLDYFDAAGSFYAPRGEYRLWSDSNAPVSGEDTAAVNLGLRFTSSESGTITGIKFYRYTGAAGDHIGALWDTSGDLLGQTSPLTITADAPTGWYEVKFDIPIAIDAETLYLASILFPQGGYGVELHYFEFESRTVGPLTAIMDTGSPNNNGVFGYSSSVSAPGNSFGSSNYWVDPLFVPAPTAEEPAAVTRPVLFVSM